MIGRRLSHYEIVAPLGAGGMGEVYRARDERLEREVALKVLPVGALTDDPARKRFRREALALARLNHPHIAAVYDFDSEAGTDFLVMELLDGVTLEERLASGPMPEKEVAALGGQVAEALETAHERGVVHRDLKPGNVMVTSRGQAKVLDFGLARLRPTAGAPLASTTLTGLLTAMGTLPYMAPEQLLGSEADTRTDLYSLGVMLYRMTTGRLPFDDALATALVYQIQNSPPPPPTRLRVDLSAQFEQVMLKCLEKDPENRYQSAKELRVDLRRLAGAGPPVPAGPRRPAPWVAGRRALIRMLLVVGGLAAVAVALRTGFFGRGVGTNAAGHIQSLVVLPLENLSRDREQDYFADGMTDELITRLAQITAFRVISRTSAMRYKATSKSVPEIGRELDVDAVVQGAVMRSGNRIRISAQLIRARTDRHLWARSYERDLSDVLRLQDDVAAAIAEEVRVTLTPVERSRLARARVVDPEAYDFYLRGRYHWYRRGPADLKRAVEYFEDAIRKDTTYALAHSGLADAYSILAVFGYVPRNEVSEKARYAVARAFQLDSTLAEVWTSRAMARRSFDFNLREAEEDFRRAIEINPNYSLTHLWYASLLMVQGRYDEATREIDRALALDPMSFIVNAYGGYVYFTAGHEDAGIEKVRQALEMDSTFAAAHDYLGQMYLSRHRGPEAVAEMRRAAALTGSARESLGLAAALAGTGRGSEAVRIMNGLRPRFGWYLPYRFAWIHAQLGDRDRAFEWLERAYQLREPYILGLREQPGLESLHGDPRFNELLRRLGLPPL